MTTTAPPAAAASSAPEDAPVADRARTVIVPVANPETVVDLLRVAHALLPTEGGRILAYVIEISDADAEKQRDTLEGLRDLVELLRSRMPGTTLELRTKSALSVTRGVLDAVRDSGADAIVLGVRSRRRGQLEVGPVADSIMQVAPCDVIVHRSVPGHEFGDVRRVVVAVDGSASCRSAVRAGVMLGEELKRPVDLVHVHRTDVPVAEAKALVDRSRARVEGSDDCQYDLIASDDVVTALAEHLNDDDLLVVGFDHEDRNFGWSPESTTRQVLERVNTPVVSVARHVPAGSPNRERLRQVLAWLHPRLTDVEQESVRSNAESAAATTMDYVTMTVGATAIATYGILLDSTAVIIGAMLVAPLMGPLQAIGVGLVAGRSHIARRGAVTVLIGIALALLFAILTGLVAGGSETTQEMVSRGSPSMLDAAVAIAAGLAGAYATARKGIPAALAGVAIAAALVPPIAVTGLAIAQGRWALAVGSGLLFSVNMVFIAAVSAAVFAWLGLRPSARDGVDRSRARWVFGIAALSVVLLAGILALQGTRQVIAEGPLEDAIREVVPDAQLIEAERADRVDDTTIRVVVEVPVTLDEVEERGLSTNQIGAVDAALEAELAAAARETLRDQLGDQIVVRMFVREVLEY